MNDAVLLTHVVFGVLTAIGGLVVLMETLLVPQLAARVRWMALTVAFCCWIAFIAGGYWYLNYYGLSKSVIVAGPRPWGHKVVMEVKEHVFLLLLMLATALPFIAEEYRRRKTQDLRWVLATVSSLVFLLALMMEGFGGLVNSALRQGLYYQP